MLAVAPVAVSGLLKARPTEVPGWESRKTMMTSSIVV